MLFGSKGLVGCWAFSCIIGFQILSSFQLVQDGVDDSDDVDDVVVDIDVDIVDDDKLSRVVDNFCR